MSPAFINRFDVIVLEDQIESLNEKEKKELIKFLLINSYNENKINSIIKKQENLELEEKNEIKKELFNIDFSKQTNFYEREINEKQENERGNNDFNFYEDGGNNDFNFNTEGDNNDFNFDRKEENNDFNLNRNGDNEHILEKDGNLQNFVEIEGNIINENNNKNEVENLNLKNDIENKKEEQLNEQKQNDNKEKKDKQNEENEEIEEENYIQNYELIDKNILNQ